MLEKDEEYSFLMKKYNLSNMNSSYFKNFLKRQIIEENFIFEVLSKCLVNTKAIFIKKYKKELGIRNITMLDDCIDQSYKDTFIAIIDE
jgi:uncharacterized phosphosugar-binding protein